MVQRTAQIGASLITLPLALHALGVDGFGVWGAATSLAWLSGMLDLGVGSALITLIPRTVFDGQSETARSHVGAALLWGCGFCVLILIVGGTLVTIGSRSIDTTPFLVAIVGLALNVPLSVANNVWFGLQRGYVAATWDLTQTVLMLGTLVVASLWHSGVATMVFAVYGPLVLVNLASLVHLMLRHPEIRPRLALPQVTSLQIVIRQGGMLFAISAAVSCSYMFDNVLALRWLGVAASAQMTMAMRLCTTAAGMIGVFTQPLWPAFVEAGSAGDSRWAWRALSWGTFLVLVLGVIGAFFIVMFGAPVLGWWLGVDIGIRPELLWATAIWIIVVCTPRVPSLLLTAAMMLRSQLIAVVAALCIALLLKYVLAVRFGIPGILLATSISWLLIVWPAFIWLVLDWRKAPNHEVIGR